jgi:glutamate dehydrogenase/leucine dehydrogenase
VHWLELQSVDGVIAFDIPEAPHSSGGTRMAPDVDRHEVALLARAMTYKFGVIGLRIAGAKAGLRAPRDGTSRAEYLRRYLEEIAPLVRARTFTTGADLGTDEADFRPLRDQTFQVGLMSQQVAGVPFEQLVTGYGLIAAADAACGGLEGRRVAIEGFGKVGGGAALEAARRGARVVAVSTVHGAVISSSGFDVEQLWELRAVHGDAWVHHVGREVLSPASLFEVQADVLIPGARPACIDARLAERLRVEHVVPGANVPYTGAALEVMGRRGIAAHADFLCNAGGAIGYNHPDALAATTLAGLQAVLDRFMAAAVEETLEHPGGPYAGACARAEAFVASWLGAEHVPARPPVAEEELVA